ncbi:MAG: multidrug efflux RND transporter permease subunit [Planctomycetota bacterium]
MSFSETFIHRPVATTLLTIALGLAGGLAYMSLPVAPLPQVEFPTISVNAQLPGASPETMASAVATPLERQFGRIAGLNELTSNSTLGACEVTLQFDLSKNIDAAAREVQAAINAARSQLPSNLPSNPSYKKVNPGDAPIMILTLRSEVYDRARMYDVAASILQQKISQIQGIGQVNIGGASLPAVRVELNPTLLQSMGVGLGDVRATLFAANANRPKGSISDGERTWALNATDQLHEAKEYRSLIVAYRRGAAIRLGDVATVEDALEDVRTGGLADGEPAVLLMLFRQPGANIIETVERVKAELPQLRAEIPAAIELKVVLDRTTTIRSSFDEVKKALFLSIGLVILVVFLFLRDFRTTLIPSIAVPVSLVGTFGVMYLCDYSLDNLSLMALTVATGFVVDDAIVVIENIARYMEKGLSPLEASIKGTREIGFTVISMSLSLIAVFIPILLMGGIVGRLFREFAVTLSAAIAVSLVVSLTTTPMMCATILRSTHGAPRGWFYRVTERGFDLLLAAYRSTLGFVLRHQRATMLVMLGTIALTGWLFTIVPRGFFPQQDTGRLMGSLLADQQTSFKETQRLLARFAKSVSEDPAVEAVIAFTGGRGGSANAGRMFVTLRPLEDRKLSADEVMARLRRKVGGMAGAELRFTAVQDLRLGGRMSAAKYQFTLQGDSLDELNEWSPRVLAKLRKLQPLVDVNSDQQDRGLQAGLTIDRDTAARLGITTQVADDALYDAFGQRQVSTTYEDLNQYRVVMEVAPRFSQGPEGLKYAFARSRDGRQVPLASFTRYAPATTLLSVAHSSQFPAVTISFNLRPGFALGQAVEAIDQAKSELGLPATIQVSFQGTAQAYEAAQAGQSLLIAAALIAVYIVLGMLYESLIHPITILSTLPSAGIGALLALLLFGKDLSMIALIGIILLIGIVKKNAILMIDFALECERERGMPPEQAIYEACLLRFRPIIMTTMAALLGGLPLAVGHGIGAELRQPLGLTIVGGLVVSQMLTLFTTPVVYLYMDEARRWFRRAFSLS